MSREQQVRDAIDRFLARVRQDTDVRLQALAADLLRIVEGDTHTSRVDVERAAVEIARAVARGGEHARHDLMARIAGAFRRLDEATTLRGIIDALADGAAGDASRVAVLLVDGNRLHSYRHHGFGPGLEPSDLPIDASPIVASAIDSHQTARIPASGGRGEARLPVFMRVPAGHLGLVIPLVVGKEVVAVVYVDGIEAQGHQEAPVWAEQVEVLVRHASARLETVTSLRTVEVLSKPT